MQNQSTYNKRSFNYVNDDDDDMEINDIFKSISISNKKSKTNSSLTTNDSNIINKIDKISKKLDTIIESFTKLEKKIEDLDSRLTNIETSIANHSLYNPSVQQEIDKNIPSKSDSKEYSYIN